MSTSKPIQYQFNRMIGDIRLYLVNNNPMFTYRMFTFEDVHIRGILAHVKRFILVGRKEFAFTYGGVHI
ncbi:hypothetical protein BpHYR1_010371 [Brachionus plicatilis]|uniref:Uncharacterized protein n=1 Tax=Brachionus plicatilis TaxID=10195 RepID=A0A3M7Q5L6_BRAPC|nr:hypothetical protein BpHYR1_010371 [Brachionus plicatilis]